MGLSRDDAGRFLPDYVDEKKAGIFKDDPFQSPGPGRRRHAGEDGPSRRAERRGRSSRSASAANTAATGRSVKFCHSVGMDYVSCSPFRVPIARLAAAQAVIEEQAARKSRGKGKRR